MTSKYTFSEIKSIISEAKASDYEKFIKTAMKKFKITDLGALDDKETVKFFNWIDKNWDAKNESINEKTANFLRLDFADNKTVKKVDKWIQKNVGQEFGSMLPDESGKSIEFEDLDDADGLMSVLKKAGFKFKVDMKEALSIAGRRKLSQSMKKNAKKNAKKRKLSMSKKASVDTIKSRATKAAIKQVKSKLLKGQDEKSLSPSAKDKLADKLKQKSGLIKKLTKKLIPVTKAAEKDRLSKKSDK